MSDDVLVRVENVSKRFCRSLKRSLWYGFQDLGSEIGGRRHGGGSGLPQSSADVQLRPDEFWAVKDVSFELRRGECLGLIGHNGAGKTTLLRMLNGLIKPDTGSITMCGYTGSIIALGAGFNPTLSGRENIKIAASVLGLSEKKTCGLIEQVIDFSELRDFIDTPVQLYSSGMQVRLGFAVTTALNPDILILDEVLAVGDVSFRTKCFNHMTSKLQSCASIFVSHNMPQISRVSSKVGYMRKGHLRLWSNNLHEGISKYQEDIKTTMDKVSVDSQAAQIQKILLEEKPTSLHEENEGINKKQIEVQTKYNPMHCNALIHIEFRTNTGEYVDPMIIFTDQEMINILQLSPVTLSPPNINLNNIVTVPFDLSIFSGGNYWISVTLISRVTGCILSNHRYALQFNSKNPPLYAPIYY
jgi:ABC-type polysaccharide/polyol phosphate transport system ATPase subunit